MWLYFTWYNFVSRAYKRGLFQFTTRVYGNLLRRGSVTGSTFLHLPHHIRTADDVPEHNVLSVQPISSVKLRQLAISCGSKLLVLLCGCYKKLRSIRIGSRICHRKRTKVIMLQDEVLIRKLFTINGLSTCSIVVCEITALTHLKKTQKFHNVL